MPSDKNPVRYVELIRVSTRGQAERDTPEIQRRELEQLRKKRGGLLIERIEVPGGISGTLPLEKRPDLLRLQILSTEKAFDEIRVYAVDRLTRSSDLADRVAVYKMALDADAIIVEAGGHEIDPADESGLGELDFMLRSYFASREAKGIRRRMTDGLRRTAASGRSVGRRLPTGLTWDKKTGQWGIDEEGAAIVRRVFDLAVEGLSTSQIANRLNAEGVVPRDTTRWAASSVSNMLRNAKFKGEYAQEVEGKTYVCSVPAIVDEETWDRVQAMMDARMNKPRVQETHYDALCRGLAVCGTCGLRMHVKVQERGRRIYYLCASKHTYHKDRQCTSPCFRVADVDDALWKAIVQGLSEPALVREAIAGSGRDGCEGWADVLAGCESRLDRMRSAEVETMRLRERDLLSAEACVQRLGEISTDRRTVEAELATARRGVVQAQRIAQNQLSLEAHLRSLTATLESTDFDTRRALLEALVPEAQGYAIIIHEDRIVISGVLPFGGGGDGGGLGAAGGGGHGALGSSGDSFPKASSGCRGAHGGRVWDGRAKVPWCSPEGCVGPTIGAHPRAKRP